VCYFQPQRRLRGRRQSGVEPDAVLASCQCRRHPLAGDSPGVDTHSQLDDAAKVKSGAAPDVVRLSIGIEDKEDLIADLIRR